MTFDGLIVGMLASLLYMERERIDPRRSLLAGRILFAIGASIMTIAVTVDVQLRQVSTFDRVGLQSLVAWACGALVLGAALGGGPQRILSSFGAFVVARLAYTTYLLHMTMIPLALAMSAMLVGEETRLAHLAAFVLCYVLLAGGASLLLHLAVERPALERWVKFRRREPAGSLVLARTDDEAPPRSMTAATDGR